MLSQDVKVIKGFVDSDARVERLRHANRMRVLQAEIEQQEAEREAAEHAAQRQRAARREQSLASALLERQAEETRKEKLLQYVRETAPELRELKAKLAAAYVAKERQAQIEAGHTTKVQAAQAERVWADENAKATAKYEQDQRQQRVEKQRSLAEQARTMTEHMALRSAAQAEAEAAYRRERAEVEAIVTRIQEEDYLQQIDRAQRQQTIKAEHSQFMQQREHVVRADRDRVQAEEAEVKRFLEEQGRRQESSDRAKREREAQKARLLEEQSRLIAADRAKKEEMELLVNELYVEQEAARQRALETAERERKFRDREAMVAANDAQKALKAERTAQQQAEELEFRRKMMEKFAADAQMDRLTAIRQKQLKAEHAAKVTEMLETRRRMEEEDRERERALDAQAASRDAEFQELVRQERERLLREHAANLEGFMPHGVVTSDGDLRAIKEGRLQTPNATAGFMAKSGRF